MTLVEIAVSMLILGLVVAGMYATFSLVGRGPEGVGAVRLGIFELQGENFARETLEGLRNSVSTDPARSAVLTAGPHEHQLPDSDLQQNSGTRNYAVEDVNDPDGILAYKRVTVTVTWND